MVDVYGPNISERLDTRDPSSTHKYLALRSNDEVAVRAAVLAKAAADYPGGYYGLALTSADLAEQGGGVWTADLHYRMESGEPMPGGLPGVGQPEPEQPPPPTPQEQQPLDENYSFETSGGSEHITQSIRTRHRVKRGGGAAPDKMRAIGDNLEGCDRVFGKVEWSYSVEVPAFSHAYLKHLRLLTGCTNEQPFFHRARGECLFLGASAQLGGPGGAKMTFKFSDSPNEETIEIVPAIDPITGNPTPGGGLVVTETIDPNTGDPIPAKFGHDYVWVSYQQTQPEAGEKTVKTPYAVYVEQIYPEANFAGLGIGGG
jgi:hypothetical protein